MKKVLVTGGTGYIGSKFRQWIETYGKDISLEFISVRDELWKSRDFSQYDAVLHLAGIAHVSRNPKYKELYYKVNRDLSIELAEKAKKEKVKQFIFMSSIIVYGFQKKSINIKTLPVPDDFYGESKLQADLEIQSMQDDEFKTLVIRTPVVYGPGCKGNFPKLIKNSNKILIFPSFESKKSMIYIDNLLVLIEKAILNESYGVFLPQNKEYMSTKKIFEISSDILNKKIFFINVFNPLIDKLVERNGFFYKVFGNKYYSMEDNSDIEYQIVDSKESIKKYINNELQTGE